MIFFQKVSAMYRLFLWINQCTGVSLIDLPIANSHKKRAFDHSKALELTRLSAQFDLRFNNQSIRVARDMLTLDKQEERDGS